MSQVSDAFLAFLNSLIGPAGPPGSAGSTGVAGAPGPTGPPGPPGGGVAPSGTPLTTSDFVLSAGWGSTAAVSAVTGTDQGWQITVTANGSGIAANPTVTLTFKNAPKAPFGLSKVIGGTGGRVDLDDALTTMIWIVTFDGLPVVGKTYVISGIGR